ncbi:hypothetical protein KY290_017880 [Solanum tuberosum]|uniref:Uncharacterized protein n=1 Tax=Solanum tuberosum TaxID=4113 RepID=A0ABQ7VCL1_SOLTU|nr:hypothetical protein KY285_016842 [Solanum tuberosum]KAH0761807.1 hypothetical protein KY290_017880 [Solanum tuberosum]
MAGPGGSFCCPLSLVQIPNVAGLKRLDKETEGSPEDPSIVNPKSSILDLGMFNVSRSPHRQWREVRQGDPSLPFSFVARQSPKGDDTMVTKGERQERRRLLYYF